MTVRASSSAAPPASAPPTGCATPVWTSKSSMCNRTRRPGQERPDRPTVPDGCITLSCAQVPGNPEMAQPILLDQGVQLAFELVGIFAFAVSGALMAIRKDFDVVGIVLLAGITAHAGGVARDVIIGAIPPVAFTHLGYFLMPVAAAAVTFFAHRAFERLTTAVLVFDAAGLGFFCVAGTLKALAYGLSPLPATALGVLTGVGGGLLRDMIAREIPALVRPDTELYAVPAVAGVLAVVGLWELGYRGPWIAAGAAAFIFVFRLVAMARHWHAPTAWRRRRG